MFPSLFCVSSPHFVFCLSRLFPVSNAAICDYNLQSLPVSHCYSVTALAVYIELHWLQVPERITFRLAILAYRCQYNMAPHYLAVQLNRVSSDASQRRLRSASTSELIVPRTSRSTIGDRAFCVTAARAWNTLTPSVQSSESLTIFRRRLKTELFLRSFPD